MTPSSSKHSLRAALAAAALVLATAAGLAADAGAGEPLAVPADQLPASEFNALMTFVAANPDCQSFADGCQICRRLTQNQLACSTPGIACHKGAWTCQAPAPAPAEPKQPQ